MSSPWRSTREIFSDLLQALTSASWKRIAIIADFIRHGPEGDDNPCHLFLRTFCSISEDAEFSAKLILLAEHSITAAVQLSIAGVHFSLCPQFLCIHQVDRARREALAFANHAIAAGHSIGFTISDFERDIILERASYMADRIDSQRKLSLSLKLGLIPERMFFVLGTHRSGTSALSGMLRDMGLDAPKDLMPPTKDNPMGYIESIGIMAENERLLSTLGTNWRLDQPLPRGWIDEQPATQWRQGLLRRLQDSFGGASFPVVKDPRFCVLLPGLSSWLQADIIDFRFALVVRHPLEVVKSLLARPQDPIAKDTSLRLWIESTLSVEQITRGMKRMVVNAQDLFQSPSQVQLQLQSFIDLDTFVGSSEGCSLFVDSELYRQRFSNVWRRQPNRGLSQCDVLEELAIRIYEDIISNDMSLCSKSFDEFSNLWMNIE